MLDGDGTPWFCFFLYRISLVLDKSRFGLELPATNGNTKQMMLSEMIVAGNGHRECDLRRPAQIRPLFPSQTKYYGFYQRNLRGKLAYFRGWPLVPSELVITQG